MARRQPSLSRELRDREWIHKLWESHQECFTALEVWTEQRPIHDYYKAHRRDWTKDQVKQHLANSDPGLAEQAHKALLLPEGVVQWCEKSQGRRRKHYSVPVAESVLTSDSRRSIRIAALARPELDYQLYARAILELLRDRDSA